jgi:hypothetical protein
LLHGLPKAVFNFALVARRRHVDEVDDEESAEVAEAKLPGNFVGGLEVGI